MTSLNPLRLLRDGVGDRLARFVDLRVEDRTRDRLDGHDTRLADHRRRIAVLEEALGRARDELDRTTGEVQRLLPHVAAQEGRLEDLRDRITWNAGSPTGESEIAEARMLVEAIRRQHAQVRVRLSGIAMYEERLRRLEDDRDAAVRGAAGEPGGPDRHQAGTGSPRAGTANGNGAPGAVSAEVPVRADGDTADATNGSGGDPGHADPAPDGSSSAPDAEE